MANKWVVLDSRRVEAARLQDTGTWRKIPTRAIRVGDFVEVEVGIDIVTTHRNGQNRRRQPVDVHLDIKRVRRVCAKEKMEVCE